MSAGFIAGGVLAAVLCALSVGTFFYGVENHPDDPNTMFFFLAGLAFLFFSVYALCRGFGARP